MEKYTYRNYFRIDTKINNYWKELKIIENVIFNGNIYEVDKNNEIEIKTSWEHVYGKLSPGEYRIVKYICTDDNCSKKSYFSSEFTIN